MHRWTIALLLALCACTSARPDAVTQAQGHEVDLYVSPGVSGEKNDIRIEVRGPRIPDISELDLTMPDMAMPPQHVMLKEDGGGSYSASGVRFSMAGTWRISVLERTGKDTKELAALDVTVR